MSARMTCPRRDETSADLLDLPSGPDQYRAGHGMVGQPRGCSYCGSHPPDDFMDAIRQGAVLGPTDKSYKVYLHLPEVGEAKFYFQHLDKDQQTEFVELLNAKRLTIGYPGWFYVLPFFVGRRDMPFFVGRRDTAPHGPEQTP